MRNSTILSISFGIYLSLIGVGIGTALVGYILFLAYGHVTSKGN